MATDFVRILQALSLHKHFKCFPSFQKSPLVKRAAIFVLILGVPTQAKGVPPLPVRSRVFYLKKKKAPVQNIFMLHAIFILVLLNIFNYLQLFTILSSAANHEMKSKSNLSIERFWMHLWAILCYPFLTPLNQTIMHVEIIQQIQTTRI